VRRLKRVEPDALLAAPDLHVECPVRTRAHTAVAGARAAVGRQSGRGRAAREVRWSGGGATRGARWSGGERRVD
jgi:hypothetical protein